jgi:hypothetical protein
MNSTTSNRRSPPSYLADKRLWFFQAKGKRLLSQAAAFRVPIISSQNAVICFSFDGDRFFGRLRRAAKRLEDRNY